MFPRIVAAEFQQPLHVSKDCQTLLSRMLTPNPAKRITIGEIMQHPWCVSSPPGTCACVCMSYHCMQAVGCACSSMRLCSTHSAPLRFKSAHLPSLVSAPSLLNHTSLGYIPTYDKMQPLQRSGPSSEIGLQCMLRFWTGALKWASCCMQVLDQSAASHAAPQLHAGADPRASGPAERGGDRGHCAPGHTALCLAKLAPAAAGSVEAPRRSTLSARLAATIHPSLHQPSPTGRGSRLRMEANIGKGECSSRCKTC